MESPCVQPSWMTKERSKARFTNVRVGRIHQIAASKSLDVAVKELAAAVSATVTAYVGAVPTLAAFAQTITLNLGWGDEEDESEETQQAFDRDSGALAVISLKRRERRSKASAVVFTASAKSFMVTGQLYFIQAENDEAKRRPKKAQGKETADH